jgi:hypothetical protein
MKVIKKAITEKEKQTCNLGDCHEIEVTTGYIIATANECGENYSENELKLYSSWLGELFKGKFLGAHSNITEIVLQRILNKTLENYTITKKF